MTHAPIGPSLPLGMQLAHLVCVATISAWIAWLWTHEEIFADFQAYLKGVVKVNRDLLKVEFFVPVGQKRPWPSIIRHWAKQKVAFGLTCQTCFVHYPSGFFIWYNSYRLIERGAIGFFYAWMFTALTGDFILWLLGVMRKSKVMEDNATRALSAEATLLEKKVDKDGVTTTPDEVIRFEHSGPTINQ